MKARTIMTLGLALLVARPLSARQVSVSGGDVSRRPARVDVSRLSTRIPGLDSAFRDRVRIGGDSAQRLAMDAHAWQGRVSSVEVDEDQGRVIWDVKIVPDSNAQTILRYRVDAQTGGIVGVRAFAGVRGLRIQKP
ncbi:MAG: PepSY domain-containing protein [Gemmatimonadaceae bacterium]